MNVRNTDECEDIHASISLSDMTEIFITFEVGYMRIFAVMARNATFADNLFYAVRIF